MNITWFLCMICSTSALLPHAGLATDLLKSALNLYASSTDGSGNIENIRDGKIPFLPKLISSNQEIRRLRSQLVPVFQLDIYLEMIPTYFLDLQDYWRLFLFEL